MTESLYLRAVSGETITSIAQDVGKTRNAIVGLINRYVQKNALPTVTQARNGGGVVAKPLPELADLGPRDCHYPSGERPFITFCGEPVAEVGASYCAAHRKLCCVAPRAR